MEDHGKKLMAKYSTGHLVVLKSDKTIRGVILDVNETGIEPKYRAFVNNEIKTWYESQILLFEEEKKEVKRVSKAVFDAALTCRLLKSPTNSSLYSLNTARIDYIPHQFRPVVKFVQSDNQRILIADGVGVGKTIEAGLVLKELEAREDIDSVLVICPKPLVSERKWEDEMKRFGEEFTALDGQKFRYCLKEMDMEGEWPAKYRKCILPYSLFDKTSVDGGSEKYPGLESVPAPQFDLVIVDAYGIIGLNSKGSANKGFLKLSPILFSPQMRLMIDLRRKHAQNEDLSAKRSAACNSGSTVSDVVPSRLLQRQSAEHTPDVDLHRSTVRYSKDVSLACAA